MTQPTIPTRRNVGPKLRKELADITIQLASVLKRKAEAAKEEKALKDRIREIAARFDLPFAKGASQYLNVPEIDQALRITRPESTPTIDPEAFRKSVGTELFHELVTVLKVELKLSEWLKALEEERVTEDQLLDSIKTADPDAGDPITISLAKPFDPKDDVSRD